MADLIDAANEAGGKDNVTAVVIQIAPSKESELNEAEETDNLMTHPNKRGNLTEEIVTEEVDSLFSVPKIQEEKQMKQMTNRKQFSRSQMPPYW